jgi:hypothetical protein
MNKESNSAEGMAQAEEHLANKALSSNPDTI